MRRVILFFIIAVILLFPSIGCYAHGPWRGKVIEADTKKPIEGAVVVAVWFSQGRLIFSPGGSSREPMKVIETMTDANGEFYFSSKYFIDLEMIREVSGPNFLIYKPGFGVSGDHSELPYHLNRNPIYKKELAIFELPRLENRKDRLDSYDIARDFLFGDKTMKLNELIKVEDKYLFSR